MPHLPPVGVPPPPPPPPAAAAPPPAQPATAPTRKKPNARTTAIGRADSADRTRSWTKSGKQTFLLAMDGRATLEFSSRGCKYGVPYCCPTDSGGTEGATAAPASAMHNSTFGGTAVSCIFVFVVVAAAAEFRKSSIAAYS